jgi:hypothetical protein
VANDSTSGDSGSRHRFVRELERLGIDAAHRQPDGQQPHRFGRR